MLVGNDRDGTIETVLFVPFPARKVNKGHAGERKGPSLSFPRVKGQENGFTVLLSLMKNEE